MNQNASSAIAESPMSPMQMLIIAVCILLTAIDGFDVLSISFAAPGIAKEWGIDRAVLGLVLSMELIGMAAGSLLLGQLADRIGRRPTILICLSLVTCGMFLASAATGTGELSACRLLTGLGIGGMLASVSALATEFTSLRSRDLTITLVAAGYPLGAVLGGTVASALLAHYDWRAVFVLGASISCACLPIVWAFMPESIEYLAQKRPADALARINRTLTRLGYLAAAELPPPPAAAKRAGFRLLFSPALVGTTILLTVAYCGHIMTSYFILKWGAKIIVDMGYSASLAGGVLVWGNVGGLIGSLLLSVLTQRIRILRLVLGALLMSFVSVAAFGQGFSDVAHLSVVAAVAGFFTQGAIVGLYAIIVQSFPTEVRAGGFGFVMGVGRGGAALSPIAAGLLFQSGVGLSLVAALMALGSILAAAMLLLQKSLSGQPRPIGA